MVSLVLVNRMMRSTVVHHVLVGLCGAFVTTYPIAPRTLSGHIGVYALFSSMAWFVDGFLGVRYLIEDSNTRRRAARACGLGYAAVCGVHWGYQALSVWRAPQALWVMPLLFSGFVYDDIVLMRWLLSY